MQLVISVRWAEKDQGSVSLIGTASSISGYVTRFLRNDFGEERKQSSRDPVVRDEAALVHAETNMVLSDSSRVS